MYRGEWTTLGLGRGWRRKAWYLLESKLEALDAWRGGKPFAFFCNLNPDHTVALSVA
jgi:hypothetical protein